MLMVEVLRRAVHAHLLPSVCGESYMAVVGLRTLSSNRM